MISVKDIVIVDIVKENSNINTITHFTKNTWQPDRTWESKKKDTLLGKTAEKVFENYIFTQMPTLSYLSYDKFRTNNFHKHAPCDGLLFRQDIHQELLENIIRQINQEVTLSQYGKISDSLKEYCELNGVYIVEIKSTRITKRHYKENFIDLEKILNDDFLEYPKHIRIDKENKINSWSDYLSYCNEKLNLKLTLKELKNIEYKNMSSIYIRIYIELDKSKAYIVGFISKRYFMENATIKKMRQVNKSEMAIYQATNIKNGFSIGRLDKLGKLKGVSG